MHPAIGASPLDLAREPIELLTRCHTRMRDVLAIARRIPTARDLAGDDVREAVRKVRTYFAVALPLHEVDEEQSIAPRLLESAARSRVEDALEAMAAQHAMTHVIVDRLDATWERLERDPRALASTREPLEGDTDSLCRLLEQHLAMEEERIFPALGRDLSAAARASILSEMRARRPPEMVARISSAMG